MLAPAQCQRLPCGHFLPPPDPGGPVAAAMAWLMGPVLCGALLGFCLSGEEGLVCVPGVPREVREGASKALRMEERGTEPGRPVGLLECVN